MLGAAPQPTGEAAQRARLLGAVTQVVAERGYTTATVTDIVRSAGVSRSTFYALFESKEACFLEAYARGVNALIGWVRAAVRGADGWRAQLRAGIRSYLGALAAEPNFARTYLLEIHAAGPAARYARTDSLRRLAETYAAIARIARGAAAPPLDVLLVLCAGTEQLVAERLRAGRIDELAALEDVFCACAEAVILGGLPANQEQPWTSRSA